jgi:hypothetical protein
MSYWDGHQLLDFPSSLDSARYDENFTFETTLFRQEEKCV